MPRLQHDAAAAHVRYLLWCGYDQSSLPPETAPLIKTFLDIVKAEEDVYDEEMENMDIADLATCVDDDELEAFKEEKKQYDKDMAAERKRWRSLPDEVLTYRAPEAARVDTPHERLPVGVSAVEVMTTWQCVEY